MANKKITSEAGVSRQTFLGLLEGVAEDGHTRDIIRYLSLFTTGKKVESTDPNRALEIIKRHARKLVRPEVYGFQFFQRNQAVFEDGEELAGEVKNLSRRYLFFGERGDFSEEIFRTIYEEGYGGRVPCGDRYVLQCKKDCEKDRFWKLKDQIVHIPFTSEYRTGNIYIVRQRGDVILNCNPFESHEN